MSTARSSRRHPRERPFQEWVEECVRLALRGDPEAWSEIVWKFEGMLLTAAMGISPLAAIGSPH
jgi:hypothetical protein